MTHPLFIFGLKCVAKTIERSTLICLGQMPGFCCLGPIQIWILVICSWQPWQTLLRKHGAKHKQQTCHHGTLFLKDWLLHQPSEELNLPYFEFGHDKNITSAQNLLKGAIYIYIINLCAKKERFWNRRQKWGFLKSEICVPAKTLNWLQISVSAE